MSALDHCVSFCQTLRYRRGGDDGGNRQSIAGASSDLRERGPGAFRENVHVFSAGYGGTGWWWGSGFERAAYAVVATQAHQEQTKRLEDLENMLATITEQVEHLHVNTKLTGHVRRRNCNLSA